MSAPFPKRAFDFVVVSNRLPISFLRKENGSQEAVLSPGGLISALGPALQKQHLAWVGWNGNDSGLEDPIPMRETEIFPVTLSSDLVAGHYDGYSNGTLWPLFHNVGIAPTLNSKWWEIYREVNLIFAARVANLAARGAIIWVHDYQMMMVPKFLREKRPDLTIGYFHHIPFCGPDIFAKLEEGPEILEGIGAANISGFQRETDRINYLECLEASSKAHDRHRARTYPVQIDFSSVSNNASHPSVRRRAAEIRFELGNPKKILLGIDRVDYTKGIIQRLESFERLLSSGEISANEVVMLQIGSLSRQNVPAYRSLRLEIEKIVGRINSLFSAADGRPAVVLSIENYDDSEILARYVASDVMIVSSLRDGMNLVAKEFIASRNDESGVLLLSPFAGASDELVEAVKADPTKSQEFDAALLVALSMSSTEQKKRMGLMRTELSRKSSSLWVKRILGDLSASR